MATNKQTFIQTRPTGGALYIWSPPPNSVNPNQKEKYAKPSFCNAKKYSQGQDWVTTYVYDKVIVNEQQERSAYVECDYVQ